MLACWLQSNWLCRLGSSSFPSSASRESKLVTGTSSQENLVQRVQTELKAYRSLYHLLLLIPCYQRETNFNMLHSSFRYFIGYTKHQASINLTIILHSEDPNPFAASPNDPR
ncbi:hypothetical protein AV530_018710 [Patagioenas fasciata monilis]|uniref:Uncharacterized protein n=1 Tax=Patagioenas fasciata monilis TaxID=372326 RepID=A0A1V4JJ88_PATFA|nr:hypothetical protein AV530_018710 [Patagioenas fasciata monilis]